jgi:hypothetical protein
MQYVSPGTTLPEQVMLLLRSDRLIVIKSGYVIPACTQIAGHVSPSAAVCHFPQRIVIPSATIAFAGGLTR